MEYESFHENEISNENMLEDSENLLESEGLLEDSENLEDSEDIFEHKESEDINRQEIARIISQQL
ncbi:6769_t:CDS:2, partial [Funneliformis geosporum]